MRTRLLAVALVTAACSTGTRTIVISRPPADASPPRPPVAVPVAPREPLEIIVARPIGRHLHVQTNRAAYVAIFEITPNEGVEIVHPVSARQQRAVTGPAKIPLWWNPQDAAPGRVRSAAAPAARYIYAIASERPLRLTDAAFVRGNLPGLAGLDSRTVRDPYLVMRALSRRFVPPMRDEQWAEDVYRLGTTTTEPARIARVYCRDGSVVEIPEEIAARAWCPAPARVSTGTEPLPARPDSIKGNNGRHLAVRARGEPVGRAPGRVTEDRVPDRGNSGSNAPGNNGRGNGVDDDPRGNGVGRGAGNPPGRGQGNGATGRGNAPGATTTPPGQMRADSISRDRPNPKPDSAPGSRPELPTSGKPDAPRAGRPDTAGPTPPPQAMNRDSARGPKPEAKPDSTPDAKSEPKAGVGQGGRGNQGPDDKPNAKGPVKADTTSAGKAEGKPKAKPDTTETKPGAKPGGPGKPGPKNPPPPAD